MDNMTRREYEHYQQLDQQIGNLHSTMSVAPQQNDQLLVLSRRMDLLEGRVKQTEQAAAAQPGSADGQQIAAHCLRVMEERCAVLEKRITDHSETIKQEAIQQAVMYSDQCMLKCQKDISEEMATVKDNNLANLQGNTKSMDLVTVLRGRVDAVERDNSKTGGQVQGLDRSVRVLEEKYASLRDDNANLTQKTRCIDDTLANLQELVYDRAESPVPKPSSPTSGGTNVTPVPPALPPAGAPGIKKEPESKDGGDSPRYTPEEVQMQLARALSMAQLPRDSVQRLVGQPSGIPYSHPAVRPDPGATVQQQVPTTTGPEGLTTPKPKAAGPPVTSSSLTTAQAASQFPFATAVDKTPPKSFPVIHEQFTESVPTTTPLTLAGLTTSPTAGAMGNGYGIESISPHPMEDLSLERSLAVLHRLTPLEDAVFEDDTSHTSLDPFVSKPWAMPLNLKVALEELEGQAETLKKLRATSKDAAKAYFSAHCAKDDRRHKQIRPFDGHKQHFVTWAVTIAEDMKDRGQSEPWAQQAYLLEAVLNKHVTKDMKETLKSYGDDAFVCLRALLYKMAASYVDRFNEQDFAAKVNQWRWPQDHLSYAVMRRTFEKLMDDLRKANGDGHVRVPRTTFHDLLIQRMPRDFANVFMLCVHHCNLARRPDYFSNVNEIIRWVLNVIHDRDRWLSLMNRQSGHQSNNHSQPNLGGRPGKPNDRPKPLAVLTSASNSQSESPTVRNGLPVLYDTTGTEVHVSELMPLFQAKFWQCKCTGPRSYHKTDKTKCGACGSLKPVAKPSAKPKPKPKAAATPAPTPKPKPKPAGSQPKQSGMYSTRVIPAMESKMKAAGGFRCRKCNRYVCSRSNNCDNTLYDDKTQSYKPCSGRRF